MSATVSAFFYGSFMNPEVMAAGGHRLDRWQIACAIGFEFRIAPHATLARAPGRAAFGIVTPMTHSQLDAVYATQSRGTLYLPEPILVDDQQGGYRPAICYIAPRQDPAPSIPTTCARSPAQRANTGSLTGTSRTSKASCLADLPRDSAASPRRSRQPAECRLA